MAYNRFAATNLYEGETAPSAGDAGTITISEVDKENRVYQQDGSNEYTVSFDVAFTGDDDDFEYQLLDASDSSVITAWATFHTSGDASPNVLITLNRSEIEYFITVRKVNNTGVTSTQALKWSVGITVILSGQSFVEHLGLHDATGTPAGYYKYTVGSGFHQSTAGAGQAELARTLIALYGCTVAIANAADGGTCMTPTCSIARGEGSNCWANETSSLFTYKISLLDGLAPDGRVEFELFIQGSTDAVEQVTAAQYIDLGGTGGLDSYVIESRAITTSKTGGDLEFIMGTLGRNQSSTGFTEEDQQVIREAIITFIDADALIYPLNVYNYGLEDGLHPNDAGDLLLGRDAAYIYNGSRAPVVTGVSIGATNDKIILTFDQDLDTATTYSTEGLRVVSNSLAQTISTFEKTATRQAIITTASVLPDLSSVDVFTNWGFGTTSDEIIYPSVNSLDMVPAVSKDNDLSATNTAPTANAGADISNIAANTVVTMDFTGSSDSDGTIVSYSVVEDTSTGVTITGANTATPSFTTLSTAATYTFTVTVTDDGGLTDTDSVTFTSVDEVVGGSTLTLTGTNIPNGSYHTVLFADRDSAAVYQGNLTFSGGSTETPELAVDAGTYLTGDVIDNNSPVQKGAVISGTTA